MGMKRDEGETDVQDKNDKGLEGPDVYDISSGDNYDIRSHDWSM